MSTSNLYTALGNAAAIPWADVPEAGVEELVAATAGELAQGGRLCAWFGVPEQDALRLVAVLGFDAENTLAVARSRPFAARCPSLTALQPQAHLFERELWEQHGVRPEGHPGLKPVRRTIGAAPENGAFYRVDGGEVHEVAVGPVHAGIIEPGHFRFQCAGEQVLHLEIALGYQHRGVEEAVTGRGGSAESPAAGRLNWAQLETVAGDTSIAHATAHAWLREALAGAEATLRGQWLRAIALELERLANHAGDLGALAGDVAFLPTSAACGRIRGDFLNLTALLCGNRFGRGLVRAGGCRLDLDAARQTQLRERLRRAMAELEEAANWLWDAGSVRTRFEGTGTVSAEDAAALGLVGPAARACGLVRDVRYDHPAGWHRFAQLQPAVWPGGDVLARARVRWLEAQRAGAFVLDQLDAAPDDDILAPVGPPGAEQLAVALVEGWRGEVCHVALTDAAGRFRRYKIVDPSFHNWPGLAHALRGQAISDFPLCNKSFNLSYCGFDL
jgi:Ni,Fe-hydrogenase III large subunit